MRLTASLHAFFVLIFRQSKIKLISANDDDFYCYSPVNNSFWEVVVGRFKDLLLCGNSEVFPIEIVP